MQNQVVPRGQNPALEQRRAQAVATAEQLADQWFDQESVHPAGAPLQELDALRECGLLLAPVASAHGGLGLGEPGSNLVLLRLLAALGSANLPLGRIYEGHLNAVLLVQTYGSPDQAAAAAEAAHAGMLFGVWNTGEPKPMRLVEHDGRLLLEGCKTFASGAGFVQRPVVTVEHAGWQMTLPRMEAPEVNSAVRIDRDSWHPLGMEGSESLTVDFSGVQVQPTDLLGKPGDFYRDPLFQGGAIRFAAVQAGAVVRLARAFADWLATRGRGSDPYQIARLGELELLAQEAVLWIERAAQVADGTLYAGADEGQSRSMVRFANMTRLGIARAATAAMAHIVAGVGARGLLRPAPFERLVRDLTMYLRQPNPDGTLAEVGRSALLEDAADYWTPL